MNQNVKKYSRDRRVVDKYCAPRPSHLQQLQRAGKKDIMNEWGSQDGVSLLFLRRTTPHSTYGNPL